MGVGRGSEPQQGAESTGVPIAERDSRVENYVEVIVRRARRRSRESLQAPGHAEVDQKRFAAHAKEQILASAVYRGDGATRQILFERAGNRPAKTPVVYFRGGHTTADDERAKAPPRGLDFG